MPLPAPVLLFATPTGSSVSVQWQGGGTDLAGYLLYNNGVLANGMKWVLVSHNTKMGAAKGAILAAEWMKTRGLLGS